MSKYILDTDIISYLWDSNSPFHSKIVEYLNKLNDDDSVAVSIITIYELNYGKDNFSDNKLKQKFENALTSLIEDQDINIFSLNIKGAKYFSQLKLSYKQTTGISSKNAKKNDLDLLIASIALSNNAILVSNDQIFKNISRLDTRLKVQSLF